MIRRLRAAWRYRRWNRRIGRAIAWCPCGGRIHVIEDRRPTVCGGNACLRCGFGCIGVWMMGADALRGAWREYRALDGMRRAS